MTMTGDTDDAGAPERATSLAPSTSTLGLTFADVERQLPAGVKLQKELGRTSLTVPVKGLAPAIGLTVGSVALGGYAAAMLDPYGYALAGFVALAAPCAYFALAFLVGRRRVVLEGATLSVRTIPLPLPGDRSTTIDEVEALQIVEVGKRSGARNWRIDVVHKGVSRPLVDDLDTKQQALVLAQYLAQEHGLAQPRVSEAP